MVTDVNCKRPEECTNITEVRNEIDRIDDTIIELLSNRLQYVKEVVKYKGNSQDSIVAEDRRRAVLAGRRKWAEERGLDPDVIEDIYDRLIKYFISEEMKIKKI